MTLVRPLLPAHPLLPAELVPLDGADWNHAEVVRGVDGDTTRLLRAQVSWDLEDVREVGDTLVSERWSVDVIRDDVEELPDGLSGRLVNLNTPERGKRLPAPLPDGRLGTWGEARDDLGRWCARWAGCLRCVTYTAPTGESGGMDRKLVDLYVLDSAGDRVADSASQHMLRLGWPPYLGAHQRTAPRRLAAVR